MAQGHLQVIFRFLLASKRSFFLIGVFFSRANGYSLFNMVQEILSVPVCPWKREVQKGVSPPAFSLCARRAGGVHEKKKEARDTPNPGLTSRHIFGISLSAGLSRAAALDLGFGAVPQLPFFPVLRRRRRRAKRKKRGFWGHPKPRQRAAALCTPACETNVQALCF